MPLCPRCLSTYRSDAVSVCSIDGTGLIPDDQDPLIGTTVSNYRVLSFVASGGMARVYRARHTVLDRDAAVKVLKGSYATNPISLERFQREARIASKIDHPNVIGVLDFGVTPEGLSYLVMEWVEGRTLDRAIHEEGPFSPARAGYLAHGIAAALAEAHRLGFIHRDLKPSNVMLLPELERPKILDFGLARPGEIEDEHGQPLTRLGQVLGTPHYIAPEVLSGRSRANQRADLYALGVVLYEMLSKTRPYRGRTVGELIAAHAGTRPAPLAAAGGLEQIAHRLLDPDPERRGSGAAAVVREIEALELPEWRPGASASTRPAAPSAGARDAQAGAAVETGSYPAESADRPPGSGSIEPPLDSAEAPTELDRAQPRGIPAAETRRDPSIAMPASPMPSLIQIDPSTTASTPRAPRSAAPALAIMAVAFVVMAASLFVLMGQSRDAEVVIEPREILGVATERPARDPTARTPSNVLPAATPPSVTSPSAEPGATSPSANARTTRPRPSRGSAEAPPERPSAAPATPDLDAALTRALDERGLVLSDLLELEATRADATALLKARRERDPAEQRTRTSALLAQLADAFDPKVQILKSKLARMGTALSTHRDRLAPRELNRLETRCLDLSTQAKAGVDAKQYRELALAIAAVERDLTKLLAR